MDEELDVASGTEVVVALLAAVDGVEVDPVVLDVVPDWFASWFRAETSTLAALPPPPPPWLP